MEPQEPALVVVSGLLERAITNAARIQRGNQRMARGSGHEAVYAYAAACLNPRGRIGVSVSRRPPQLSWISGVKRVSKPRRFLAVPRFIPRLRRYLISGLGHSGRGYDGHAVANSSITTDSSPVPTKLGGRRTPAESPPEASDHRE